MLAKKLVAAREGFRIFSLIDQRLQLGYILHHRFLAGEFAFFLGDQFAEFLRALVSWKIASHGIGGGAGFLKTIRVEKFARGCGGFVFALLGAFLSGDFEQAENFAVARIVPAGGREQLDAFVEFLNAPEPARLEESFREGFRWERVLRFERQRSLG